MPTYSYKCTSCDNAFDIHQSFSDAALTTCPECGQALRKVFSPVGVTFKGSGFYRTDSRSGTPRASSSHSAMKTPEKAASTTSGSDSSSGSSTSSSSAAPSGTPAASAPAS